MLIVLLNFLIAIVSQAFDEVVDLDRITYYEQRAQLNSEYRYFKMKLGWLIKPLALNAIDYRVYSASSESKEISEWKGFVK